MNPEGCEHPLAALFSLSSSTVQNRLVCVKYPRRSRLKATQLSRLLGGFASPAEVQTAERQVSRFLPLKVLEPPDSPGGPASPRPAFDLTA